MRRVVALLPLLLAGCWPFGGPGATIGPDDLVVCVQNDLAAYGNLIARVEGMRYDVMPGATVCRRVNAASPRLALSARTMGGGAAGPLDFTDALPSTGPGCWLWRLGPGRGSNILSLDCLEVRLGG